MVFNFKIYLGPALKLILFWAFVTQHESLKAYDQRRGRTPSLEKVKVIVLQPLQVYAIMVDTAAPYAHS